jgi:hypothetical protein
VEQFTIFPAAIALLTSFAIPNKDGVVPLVEQLNIAASFPAYGPAWAFQVFGAGTSELHFSLNSKVLVAPSPVEIRSRLIFAAA